MMDRRMPETPPFDLKCLMERCFHERAFVRELLGVFQSQAVRDLTALNEAVQIGDPTRIASVAHKIKGSAANISADRLKELCGELEDSANAGIGTNFASQSADIADEIARCSASLPAIFATL